MDFVLYEIRRIVSRAGTRRTDEGTFMILVTGGATGTVGRPLIGLLRSEGADVRAWGVQIRTGDVASVTGEAETILGRPALTFAEWVAHHAAEFRN
jgi:nucleoside-diphosphate-sugar epimerase